MSEEIKGLDVRKYRKKHNLSQKEFAELLGISFRTVQNYEKGDIPHSAQSNLREAMMRHEKSKGYHREIDTPSVNDPSDSYGLSFEKSTYRLIRELKSDHPDSRWSDLEKLIGELVEKNKEQAKTLDLIQSMTGSIHKLLK